MLGVSGGRSTRSRRWRTMPQYVGHLDLVREIERRGRFNRSSLAGNAFGSVGIPACIHSGEQAARSSRVILAGKLTAKVFASRTAYPPKTAISRPVRARTCNAIASRSSVGKAVTQLSAGGGRLWS